MSYCRAILRAFPHEVPGLEVEVVPIVRADPYDVQVEGDEDFVKKVLQPLADIEVKDRWEQMGDDWFCVDHLRSVRGTSPRWLGAIQRSFTYEHPLKSGPKVATESLGLENGTGVASHIAFLYDETEKLIWLQRDRNVIGKLSFTDYLRIKSSTTFAMVPRLRTDSVERARTLKHIRRFEFAYLSPADVLKRNRSPLTKLLSQFGTYGAYRIEVALIPSRGTTLDPDARELVAMVADAVDEGGDEIPKAQVKGRVDENEDDTFIDLVRDKQKFAVEIRHERSRDAERLITAVSKIWSDNRRKV